MTYGSSPYAAVPYAAQGGVLAGIEVIADSIKLAIKVGQPAIGQIHNLDAQSLVFGHRTSQPLIGHNYQLEAESIKFGIRLELSKYHLNASGIKFGPRLEEPSISQIHGLDAESIKFGFRLNGPDAGNDFWFVHRSGVWYNPEIYAKHSGTWKLVDAAWIKYQGVWYQIYFG